MTGFFLRSLQRVESDLVGALTQVQNITNILIDWKNDESAFVNIFEQATGRGLHE